MALQVLPRSARRGLAAVALVTAVMSLAGCGETTVSVPLPASRVDALSNATFAAPAGTEVADPIEVLVVGTDNQPLPGATVTFSTQSGSVDPATATTDADGIASTRWTVGTAAGQHTLSAAAGSGVSATFTANVTAAAPATVSAVAGNAQTAPAGTAVPTAPSVQVADAFGNLAQGVPVTFSVLSGGGRVTGGVATTDATGVATVGSWVLGSATGEQTLAARVEAGGVANNPVLFTATATTPTGSQMVATAGDGQHATVGQLVPIAPTVVVRNGAGDGIPGVVVTFAVATGGGGVVGSRQVTDATGMATVGGWFLGPLAGTNTLTASSTGLPAVTFTATGVAGIPTSMVAVSQTTQSATAGTAVADPPSVIVRDAAGVPVAGVVVTFTVTAGGGSVTGSPDTTNASGVATVSSWTLGTAVGANTVRATATGLPAVTFNASGTAGTAATVAAYAGDAQAAVQGTSVAVPPTVLVSDAGGNPVIGATVTFAVGLGGGAVTGTSQVTDTQGRASVGSWTLGSGTPNTLTATVTGSGIAGNPVTFTAQSATQIAITGVPGSPVALGASFAVTAQLRSSAGAAVALQGVPLTIAIASGGGALGGTLTLVTNASGVVSFTGLSVTGVAGDRTFTISGASLASATSSAITFN